ncbi:uncharacterized protein LOC118465551 [Anopheles albimanus]|uniref:Tetratricopeptide repeat protein 29 n=1 Tax=Anopheles albimanus TaxID=7167 RepID=A0A182FKN3_ANOAL|nr:uncharacterized protein LOC118465551 [Anopheles albimanus]XP_035789774.1 uncharacterized protein LOC118465551 [Anopheles albimanus]
MSSTSSLIRPGLTTPVSSQLAQIKLRLRKKVPLLSGKDVRRERIPYYEAISSELYERGYTDAAFLVLDLIEFEDRHVWPTSEPPVEERRLRHSRKLLDYLLSSLGRAQQYKYDGQYERETEELLGMARKFERDAEKRWLARQFYLIALERSGDVPPTIRPKVQAKVRYYYAKLLLQLRKPVKAMQQLEDADNALMLAHSKGYPVGQTLEENRTERLEVAINTVLFEVHAQMAKDCRRSPVWMQGQYIRGAHQAALKTQKASILAESFIAYGDFMAAQAQDYPAALTLYKTAIQQAELDGSKPDLLCKARIALAITYHRLGEPSKCEELLKLVNRITLSEPLTLCRASYLFTAASIELEEQAESGEAPEQTNLPANQGTLAKLHQSANIYRHFRQQDKMMEALCLEGLTRAAAQFGAYLELLPTAISTSDAALYRMIDWFDEARPPTPSPDGGQ